MGGVLGDSGNSMSPPPPPPLPPAAIAPTLANPAVRTAGANEKNKAKAAAAKAGLSSKSGDLTKPVTTSPELLGSV